MISSNIAYFRRRAGLTQAELAQKLNISQAAVARYEAGTKSPVAPMLAEMSRILSATAGQLIGIEPIKE